MAFTHGSKLKFRLDNAAGTLTDVSNYTVSVSMQRQLDLADASVAGLTAKQSVTGLEDSSFSVEFKYDPVIDAQLDGIRFGITGGGTVSFQYDPQGTGTGLPRYSGECWVTQASISTPIGDAASISASFQITAGITRSTQP